MKRSLLNAIATAIFAVHRRTDVTCSQEQYVERVREAIRLYAAVHLERGDTEEAAIALAYIRRLDRQFGIAAPRYRESAVAGSRNAESQLQASPASPTSHPPTAD